MADEQQQQPADPALEAQRRAEEFRQRQAARDAKRPGGPKSGADEDAPPPIREAATMGRPETHQVKPGLLLRLRAPVIADADQVHAAFLAKWPDVLLWAALSDRIGSGVDFAKASIGARAAGEARLLAVPEPIAEAAREFARLAVEAMTDADPERRGEEAVEAVLSDSALSIEDGEMAMALAEMLTYSPDQAKMELRNFSDALRAWGRGAEMTEAEENPEGQHVLDGIADTVWMLAGEEGWNPSLTRETLPEALLQLRPAEHADLLRRCLDALDGTDEEYRQSVSRRFGTP